MRAEAEAAEAEVAQQKAEAEAARYQAEAERYKAEAEAARNKAEAWEAEEIRCKAEAERVVHNVSRTGGHAILETSQRPTRRANPVVTWRMCSSSDDAARLVALTSQNKIPERRLQTHAKRQVGADEAWRGASHEPQHNHERATAQRCGKMQLASAERRGRPLRTSTKELERRLAVADKIQETLYGVH